jgi:very-short-patch-repair endonuclease
VPLTDVDYQALADERGFRWLAPMVANARTSTSWECDLGHTWETTYNKIQQGTGCPVCSIDAGAEKRRVKPAAYKELAEERGFRWLGPKVRSVLDRTWWECQDGHRWQATYGNLYHQGTGCPSCADMVHGSRVSKIQRELCETLGGKLNEPVGSFRVDVAVTVCGTPIAVEYDAWYWHGNRQEHDAQRNAEIIDAGWRVLRVRSNPQLPTLAQLDGAIDRLVKGESRVEIVLPDWGVGPTRFDPS